jgi:membrane-bound metal-dependent hydrolase YbcI (DUF457 family)
VKGIAHFVTGVAIATFFPEVVDGAAQHLSFGPLLGGLAGLLPDTLDFKFVRYFDKVDVEVDPAEIVTDSGSPDTQAIAERIADAMNQAHDQRRMVKMYLHSVRLGSDLWRRYSVTLDVPHSQVMVDMGPVVTTAQVPYSGSEIPGVKPGQALVSAPILNTYDDEVVVDIFNGVTLAFERVADAIQVTFMPWHRIWTHSLTMALLAGIVGALIAPVYGLVMALAVLAHIVQDQWGFMGCNLWFPFTRRRTRGLMLMRSGDAVPSFLTVWVGVSVILLNLDRFSGDPSIPVGPYVLAAIVAPCLFFLGLGVWERWWRRRFSPLVGRFPSPTARAAVEALDETNQVDI